MVWSCTNTMATIIVLFFVYSSSNNSSNALIKTLSSISVDLQCGQMSRLCSHLSLQLLHQSIFLQYDATVIGDTDVCWHIKHLKQLLALFRSSSYLFILSLISFTFCDNLTEKGTVNPTPPKIPKKYWKNRNLLKKP